MKVVYKGIMEQLDEVIEYARKNDKEISYIVLSASEMAELRAAVDRRTILPTTLGEWNGPDGYGYFYDGVRIKEAINIHYK